MLGINYTKTGEWLKGTGPESDIVISSRVRLARNLEGFRFINQADAAERHQLIDIARQHGLGLRDDETLAFSELDDLEPQECMLLVERHMISKELAKGAGPRGVIVSGDESLSIMVNEEDHYRIQVIRSGLQLHDAYDEASRVDEKLDERVQFAYHQRFGYLTACPTNVGTGIRVSVMLHLPALILTKEIERVRRAAHDIQLAVRGFYGEGSETLADIFQVSNQTTLGKTEPQLLADFDEKVIPQIIEYERGAREVLLKRRRALLDDRCHRARGVLASARIIKQDEALSLLSHLRLGVALELITDISMQRVNNLLLMCQTAHLQHLLGRKLEQAERAEERARFIREALSAD